MTQKQPSVRNLLSSRSLALLLVITLGLGWAQPVQAALVWQIQIVDSAGDVGQFTALVLDSRGNPVISYYDATNQELKLLHCGNATCSSGNSTVTVDSEGNVGWYNALVLDSSGNPVISYQDVTFRDLKLAHCGNPDCSSGNHIQNVAGSSGDLGYGTSLRLDSSGNPVISYTDNSNGHLKLAHCVNPNCTGVSSIVTVDSVVGWSNSLALNSSGNPVISYSDLSNNDLKLVTCGDRNCSSGNIKVAIDGPGSVGRYNALVLDSRGNPVISYFADTDGNNGHLKLVHCGNTLCSSGNQIQIVDSNRGVGRYNSLVLDSNGNPVISYFDASNGTLQLAHCGNPGCTSGNQIQTVDSERGRIIGHYTALALDSSGHPVISYYDAFNKDLKLARVVDDSTSPGVTLNQATGQADPTSSGPIHFTAFFNEPVNNFATGDVTLSGSAGATTATVTQVAPNDGTTFDVAVSGMTNNGTVSVMLAAGVATDAAGNPNTAATSTDNTVAFNLPPVASDDAYTTLVDRPLLLASPGVLGNDSDPANLPPFTAVLVSSTGHGTLTLNLDGSFSYVPLPGYVGLDSFTYRAHNATLASTLATVTISVNRPNQPPVAVDDSFNTNVGLAVTGNVLKNDSNPDPQPGRPLTAIKLSDPGHGTLMLNRNGSFTYTPLPDFIGTDSFTYKANDGKVDSNVATVTIQVLALLPVNTAPVANSQIVTIAQNRALPITLTGDDVDGDPLTYTLVTQPSHGTVSGTAPTLTYTPLPDFTGMDGFTFQVNDGQADSTLATIAIEVVAIPPPVNTAPIANSQIVTTAQNRAKSITLTGGDAEGDPLTYTLVTQPGHGVLSGMAPNLTYTPVTNFSGLDSFTFQVNDGQADSPPATVTIHVSTTPPPINTAPVAHNQTVTTTQGSRIVITLSATDDEGDPLTYQVISPPQQGALGGMAPALVYTPTPGYNGADSFTYQVHDGQVDSALATVQIRVTTQPNRPPTAQDDAFTVTRNSQGTVLAVLTNDHDLDGDGLTLLAVAAPAHGTAQTVNGQLRYAPAAEFVGMDQFTYMVSDGKAAVVATVSVTVTDTLPLVQAVYLPLVQR